MNSIPAGVTFASGSLRSYNGGAMMNSIPADVSFMLAVIKM